MNKRFNSLSIYRLIATLCIIQYHVFFVLYNRNIPYETLLSKAVQGLTALSGFLYSQKVISDNKKFLLNNILKIVVPAVLCIGFMAIWNLTYMFINKDWNYFALWTGRRTFDNSWLIQFGNFYYLGYILACYLITPVLKKNNIWSVVVIILSIGFDVTIGYLFGSSFMMIAYIAGYYIGRKWYATYVDKEKKFNIWVLILWIAIVGVCLASYFVLLKHPYGSGLTMWRLHTLTKNVPLTLFGIGSFFLISYIFKFTNKYETFKVLMYTDSICLMMFLMNQCFMVGAMNITVGIEVNWAKFLLVNAVTIATSVLLKLVYDLIRKRFVRKEVEAS